MGDKAMSADDWQPIESAPHNVKVILFWQDWRDGTPCMVIGFAVSGQRFDNGYSSISRHGSATHWRPLPPPPRT
jgi:hypothetical protein